ncbi:MAG: PASTA domain-containing protein [Solobacterium sp.]|nr:PASTA domain-containing protein [Solobacterium sp.]
MSVDWKNRRTITLLIVAVLLFAATAAGGIYLRKMNRNPVLMEDFTGRSRDDVMAWAEQNNIPRSQMEFNLYYDEEIEENIILDQSIAPDTEVMKDDVLVFSVSNGKDPELLITLPDFTGMSQEEIEDWFSRNGFVNVYYIYEEDAKTEKNRFIGIVEEGTEFHRNDEISVRISLGSEDGQQTVETTVPDFSSYSRTNIQAWASANRVTVYFRTAPSDTVEKGKVVSQNPAAGTKITSGGSVTVTLSSGKAITVASFAGKTKGEADAWIRDNGLKAIYSEQYSAAAAEGTIMSQNPSSGTLSEGDTVTFVLSIGYVSVNDYTGKTLDSFQAYINSLNAAYSGSAGLKLETAVQETNDNTPGTIISQSASGSVAPGTTIKVTVASAKKIAVDSKAGMPEGEFLSYLASLPMRQGTASRQYSDSVAAGSLISNTTGTFEANTAIDYVLSLGSYVPDAALYAAGTPFSSLQNAINNANKSGAGWTLNTSYADSETYDSGTIINGSASGKTITVTVSSGKVATVPNVIGTDASTAEQTLRNAGFTVSLNNIGYSNDHQANIVFAQSVAGGEKRAPGTQIIISLSDGPKPVETAALPNFPLGLYDNASSASSIISSLTQIYNNAGFYNLSFTTIPTGGDTEYSNMTGIKSITPPPNGAVIDKTTLIVFEIFEGETN